MADTTRTPSFTDDEARHRNPYPRRPPVARFHDGYRVDDSGCWVWTKATNPNGYGRFSVNGSLVYAHRFALHINDPSVELNPGRSHTQVVDHLCRNRSCVNPDHLRVVSQRVNAQAGANCELKPIRSSRFAGVQDQGELGYYVSIVINGRRVYLGRFDCEQSAAMAYAAACIELGESPPLGHPSPTPTITRMVQARLAGPSCGGEK